MVRGKRSERTEAESLRLFVALVDELRHSRVIRSGANVGLNVSFAQLKGMEITVRQPEEEALRSYLLTFRKFVSPDEDVHLPRIYKVLERRLTSDELRALLRESRAAWKGSIRGRGVAISVDGRDVTPDHAMDLWINGAYFHNDSRKTTELERLGAGAMFVRWRFLDAVLESTKHVLHVGSIKPRDTASSSR